MKDCNCKGIATQLALMIERGHEVDPLVAGLDYSIEDLLNPRTQIDWNTAALVIDRMFHTLGKDRYIEYAQYFIRSMHDRFYSTLAPLVIAPRQLYSLVVKTISPSIYPVQQAEIREVGDTQLEIHLRIPRQLRGCEAFFWAAHAAFEYLPNLIHLDKAKVSSDISAHKSEHLVAVPESQTILSRGKRLAKRLQRPKWDALQVEYEALQNQYVELAESHLQLERRERQLLESVSQQSSSHREITNFVRDAQSGELDSLSKLAGGVAHYFNNQLTVIQGFADLLANHPDHEVRERAGNIFESANDMSSLTSTMLSFAQGQMLAPQRVQLDGFFRQAEALIKKATGPRSIVKLDVSPGTVLSVDPSFLMQAVMQITQNAREAMGPSGGLFTVTSNEVELTDHEDLKQGRYAKIEFEDTGPGIDHEVVNRVLEPFFSTKETRLGLGLSMVYGFAAQSNGTVEVGAGDVGTRVTILLPTEPEPSRP
jgi:signal transduction histidine kinase